MLSLALVLSACTDTTEAPVADSEILNLEADNVIYGMSSYLTVEGVREGHVEADTAYMYVDSAHVDLRGMTIVFHDDNGRPRATVTGRTGDWDQNRDIMIARGDVLLVIHGDDREIRTEELHYDAYRERIWSDSTTTQTLADGTVTRGSAFESDLEFEDVRIENIRGGGREAP
ncbi:MAG: LPS export ABC transporter periplasmic protein LptC [Gemmatimonadota bacterium]|nr:LPS export ABC transporter periplasmic protein LptC [Gemmatimonadota bacterium]